MEEIKHGTITVMQSVGNQQSVGEGSPEHAEVTKENLPPKKTRGRPKGSTKNKVGDTVVNEIVQPMSKVRLGYGVTKSLGNFEFIRIDVSAEDYCFQNEKQKAWEELDVIVSERIQKCISEYERFRSSKYITSSNEVAVTSETAPDNGGDPVKEESKKFLTKLIMNAAKFGKIGYAASLEKSKSITSEIEAQKVITQLESQDYSFFEERQHEREGSTESN